MSTRSAPTLNLPIAALLGASALLGACGSSGGDDAAPPPADDASGGGAVSMPEVGGDVMEPGGTTMPPGSETPVAGGDGQTEVPSDGSGGTPGGDTGAGPGKEPAPDGVATQVAGGISGSVTGETTSFGTVQITQGSDGEAGSAFAAFVRTNLPIPAGQAITSLVPPLDTCTVTRPETGGGGLPDLDGLDFDFDFDTLSAGETITFTSPAGTWLTLPRRQLGGFVGYGLDEDLPQPVPGGLVVDIPGDVFPAFSAVPVPDVVPLAGTSPAGTSATADTTFRWQAGGGDPSVFVQITVTTGGGFTLPDGLELPDDILDNLPAGGFPGLGDGGPTTVLDCFARDDGEFALPAATRVELGADFSGVPVYSRLGSTVVRRGNTLLLVFNGSSSD